VNPHLVLLEAEHRTTNTIETTLHVLTCHCNWLCAESFQMLAHPLAAGF